MPFKAIETHYGDCRFRSRLEARWAIYFDSLAIKWNYEPEGYQLPTGAYLPDFWLPQVKMFAEVKPDGGFGEREKSLCCELSEVTQRPVLMLEGQPDRKCYWSISYTELMACNFELNDLSHPKRYWESEGRFYWVDGSESWPTGPEEKSPHDDDPYGEKAVRSALMERFDRRGRR